MCWWYEFSFDIWGRFGKHYHSILKVDVEIVVLIVEFKILIWEHFLRRFQIFSHLLASWFHPFFFLRKSYRWYMCFINDETAVILAVVPKPIWPKAECILYIRKKQGFFFFLLTAFLCHYIRLALTPSWGLFFLCLVDIILEIHSRSLCLHRDLLQVSWQKITYLYFLFSADIQTQ